MMSPQFKPYSLKAFFYYDIEKGNSVGIRVKAMLDEIDRLRACIERSGLDVSPCMICGEPVVCVPDGVPMCEECAAKE